MTSPRAGDIAELHKKGLSSRKIAAIVGMSRSGVGKAISRLSNSGEIEAAQPSPSPTHRRPWSDEDTSRLILLHNAGKTDAEVAQELGRTYCAVGKKLKMLCLTGKHQLQAALASGSDEVIPEPGVFGHSNIPSPLVWRIPLTPMRQLSDGARATIRRLRPDW